MRDAGFSRSHTARQVVQIFGSRAPIGEGIADLALDISELQRASASGSGGSADGNIRDANRAIRGDVHGAFGHAHPIAVGGNKVGIRRAQIVSATGGTDCGAIRAIVSVIDPNAKVHARR